MSLKLDLTQIPAKIGVYIFKSKKRQPIYIGKTTNLRERLKQHLHSQQPKMKLMLAEAVEVEILTLDSEIEALLKESHLIKQFNPKYNQLLRDDTQFFYVGFTKDRLPKVFITHQPQTTSGDYLGPFVEGQVIKTLLKVIRRGLPICTCLKPHLKECLNSMLGLCFGWCCRKGEISLPADQRLYLENVEKLKRIFRGDVREVKMELLQRLKTAVERDDLELGTKLKREIDAINKLASYNFLLRAEPPLLELKKEQLRVLQDLKTWLKLKKLPYLIEAYDISHLAGQMKVGIRVLYRQGQYDRQGLRRFRIYSVAAPDDPRMIAEVLKRRLHHLDWGWPDLILIDGGREQFRQARRVLVENGLDKIKLISLAKPHGQVYYNATKPPILLSSLPLRVRNFIQAIDKKAHQAVLGYHRYLREKPIERLNN